MAESNDTSYDLKKRIFAKEHYDQFILNKWVVGRLVMCFAWAQVLFHIEDHHLGP